MESEVLTSPDITAVEYELLTLTLTFDSTSVIRYFNVFPSLYMELLQTDDKVEYFRERIKGKYYGMKLR